MVVVVLTVWVVQVIEAGLVPVLVRLLRDSSRPQLQLEACWALTNVAGGSSEHTKAVVDSDAVPQFIQLLSRSTLLVF